MTIAVLAANGRTGQAFVAAALAAGLTVRAGVRRSHSLPARPNLSVVQCNAMEQQDVARLIGGCEAVVSLIGHVRKSPKDLQSVATGNLMKAMDEHGIRRLVSLTGTGARQPGDKISLMDRLLNFGITTIDPARIRDGIEHVRLLEQSGVHFTVVRVLKLHNQAAGTYSLLPHGPAKTFVSRNTVALAILDIINNQSFVRSAPIIGKK